MFNLKLLLVSRVIPEGTFVKITPFSTNKKIEQDELLLFNYWIFIVQQLL